ncbi:hypothetical protein FRC17_009091 [Serendipita sp. 399]|nr:hypothetical protein FRC17_009091 [Serendipita sp. 399]
MALATIAAPIHTANIGQLANSMYLDMVGVRYALDTAHLATIRLSGSGSDPTNWVAKQLRERLAKLWTNIANILSDSRQFASDATTLSERFRDTNQRELHIMMKEMSRIGEGLFPKIAKSEADLQTLPDEFPYAVAALVPSTSSDEHTPLKESFKDLQDAENKFKESIRALHSRHEAIRQFWKQQLDFIDYVLNTNDARRLPQVTEGALKLANSWKDYEQALRKVTLDILEISTDIIVPNMRPTRARTETDLRAWSIEPLLASISALYESLLETRLWLRLRNATWFRLLMEGEQGGLRN